MKILTFFLIVAILVAGLLGYFGLIPGVSDLLGSNKPRDLGMTYSSESFSTGLAKGKVEMKTLEGTSSESLKYEGSHEVIDSFTDEELTSHAYNKEWENYPISDVQVRINDDNTCEVSGMIDLAKVDGLLSELNISQANYKKALESVNIPMKKMPFYAKGSGVALDNHLDASISTFELGRFPVPSSLLSKYGPMLMSFGDTVMSRIDGFSVKEARFENNAINFEGTLPDVEYTKK
jgi:hypothetical protein